MARPSIGPKLFWGPKFILLDKTLFALEKQKESNFWPDLKLFGLDHFSLDSNLFCLKLGKNSYNLHIFFLSLLGLKHRHHSRLQKGELYPRQGNPQSGVLH